MILYDRKALIATREVLNSIHALYYAHGVIGARDRDNRNIGYTEPGPWVMTPDGVIQRAIYYLTKEHITGNSVRRANIVKSAILTMCSEDHFTNHISKRDMMRILDKLIQHGLPEGTND